VSGLLRAALRISSALLPRQHRERWREESLAVLLAVDGARRWRYALDTIIKAPVLAGQHRRTGPDTGPGAWVAAVAAAGLLSIPVLLLAGLVRTPWLGEDAGEFLFLVAACGMLPTVAVHSWRSARRRGGGPVRYAVALLVTVFAGTGPIAAGALSVATGTPAVAFVGSLLPGAWLAVACGSALHDRRGPVALAVLGGIAGVALTGVLFGLQLWMHAPGAAGAAISLLGVLVLVPTYLAWSTWTAMRILLGERDVLGG
jgi:hypothetical protein